MRTYTQLTQEQRYQIYSLLKMGHPQVEIAGVIGVHKSTISRELKRNRGLKGYRPKQAHQFALNRRKKPLYRIDAFTWILIEALIRQEWSPEQVSDWLKVNYGLQISHEWVYQYILMDKHAGGDLHRHLRCQKKRRKRYESYDRRGKIRNRVSIDERPAIVDTRHPHHIKVGELVVEVCQENGENTEFPVDAVYGSTVSVWLREILKQVSPMYQKGYYEVNDEESIEPEFSLDTSDFGDSRRDAFAVYSAEKAVQSLNPLSGSPILEDFVFDREYFYQSYGR